ncbi:MAG: NTP transferase domain-containing protein [Pirellulaceae bacterium]
MDQTTIVINAAGCGSRLGKNLPKSLVEIAGKPILEWQLTTLCQFGDAVRIVVGYRGDEVGELASRVFPGIEILQNKTWKTTKTAASLSIGANGLEGRCLSLDGDLLVHPEDFRRILLAGENMIGVTQPGTSHPVFADVNSSGFCTGLSYGKKSRYEWTGLVNFFPPEVPPSDRNVYEMIEGILPVAAMDIRCVEIDTPEDLLRADQDWPTLLEVPANG